MDMLDLEKLMAQTTLVEGIVASVEDTQEYNIVTKKTNSKSLTESVDFNAILSNAKELNGKIDFTEVESAVKSLNESTNANPSAGITTADAFLNAKPIKQTEFVTANTPSKTDKELENANTTCDVDVTAHKSETAVEKQADSIVKEKQSDADKNKKWDESAKKQNVDKVAKFENYIGSLKNEDNMLLIESIQKALNIILK